MYKLIDRQFIDHLIKVNIGNYVQTAYALVTNTANFNDFGIDLFHLLHEQQHEYIHNFISTFNTLDRLFSQRSSS